MTHFVVLFGRYSHVKHTHFLFSLSTDTAPEDYDSTTELLTFSSSNTQHSVLIPIANDDFNEALEQFFVGLTFDDGDNRNIEVQPPAAVIMIIDDDSKIYM